MTWNTVLHLKTRHVFITDLFNNEALFSSGFHPTTEYYQVLKQLYKSNPKNFVTYCEFTIKIKKEKS